MSRAALGLGLGLLTPAHRGAAASEPSEFITNGSFAVDANWTKGAGWSIAAGVATQDGSSPTGALSQNFGALTAALINGNDYVLAFDLTNALSGTVTAVLGGGVGSQGLYGDTGAGAISVPFTATDARTTISFRSPDEVEISVDNVSIMPA